MTTRDFINELQSIDSKPLVFYPHLERPVPPGYHITEVMTMQIDSVDCGGRVAHEVRTVLQLWNGSGADDKFLTTTKAAAILVRVNAASNLDLDSEFFVEWGDDATPTSTYKIVRTDSRSEQFAVHLFVPATRCKPADEMATACCSGASACC